MNNQNNENSGKDLFLYADESASLALTYEQAPIRPWFVLIIDDDEQVHSATEFALADVQIQGRPLKLLHAFNEQEARQILAANEDIAVIFLDVVMEREDSGLKLVHVIRDELGMKEVRIILRTGQPGYAPELQAIRDYDINDYRNKSELTITRLVTSLTSAIRSYEQIRALSYSRKGLEKIIQAASELFEVRALESMAEGVLTQIAGMLGFPPHGVVCAQRGFPVDGSNTDVFYVIGAVGRYSQAINKPLEALGDSRIEAAIRRSISAQQSLYTSEFTVLYLNSNGREEVIFVETDKVLNPLDQQLLEVFASNISIGFSNIYLFQRLNYLAYNDPVTGLPNRRRMIDEIDLMKRDPDSPFMVILVDIDHFSAIHDVFGTSLGDLVLRSVAERMLSRLPANCHLGRYGGDTLCVICNSNRFDPATLLDIFIEPFQVSGCIIPISVTMGGCVSALGATGQELMKNAALALNRAKQNQRGRYLMYAEEMSTETRYRLDLLQSMRIAFNEKQFRLFYQPQIDMETGRVVGAEALLRWMRPDGQVVSPAEFIPLAEHSGLIVEIGDWVMKEAFRQLREWINGGLSDFKLSINISTHQLKPPAFAEALRAAVVKHDLDPGQIELEMTESMIVDDEDRAIHCLNEFKRMGFLIALDDFGTGFSSLAYLQRLPIHTLKVDRAFIKNIGKQAHGERIAEMIVALSKLLQLNVIAEGIETDEQASVTRSWGCRIAQGFLFAPAMPPDEFLVWLKQQNAKASGLP